MSGVDLSHYDEEQVRLMAEMCILVDRDDKAIGAETKKACTLCVCGVCEKERGTERERERNREREREKERERER
jgi:hypothetical protein